MFWLRRKARERDLERELESHLELERKERQESGEPLERTHDAARRAFGNATLIKEITREVWGWTFWERLWQDVRYALRIMRRSPVVTMAAIVSLALGIGANTAIFGLVDRVMLEALPVKNSDELVLLGDGVSSASMDDEPFGKWGMFSYPVYKELSSRNEVFSGMLAFLSFTDRTLIEIDRGEAELATPKLVSGNYFSVLGVRALIGRTFGPEDDKRGAAPVAVLSYSFWDRRFGRDPAMIGRSIVIRKTAQEGVPIRIAGVAPRGFFGEKVGASPEFWLPLETTANVVSRGALLDDRRLSCLQMLGRLKPGISEAQAQANIDTVFRGILTDYAGSRSTVERRRAIERTSVEIHSAARGISVLRMRYAEPLQFLLALTGIVLAIACANIANLLMARSAAREREMAVRVAIGAGRVRLLRQMLTESVVLALLGGALGVVFAWWANAALIRFVSGTPTPVLTTGLNLRMLLFTAGASLGTGLLFGLAPALRAAGAVFHRPKLRFARVLVGAQIALTLVLLVAAGAFVRSLENLRNLDGGFRPGNVLLFELDPRQAGLSGARLVSLYDRILERIGQLPGVEAASLSRVTYSRGIWGDTIRIPGDRKDHIIRGNVITPSYFETMGIPLVAGRIFGREDSFNSAKTAIVNETLARSFFGSRLAVGRHFSFVGTGVDLTVVGVVRDFKYNNMRENTPPLIFLPHAQFPGPLPHLAVRSVQNASVVTAEVRQGIRDIASSVPVISSMKFRELIDRTLMTEILVAQLATFFGFLAVVLACVGIYGTLSYAVTARTKEIGIRVALGARPNEIRWIVLRDILVLVAAGSVAGIAATVAAERLVHNLLFGIKGTAPTTVAGAVVLLIGMAAAAAYVPVRRASKVDPLVALRHE